MLLIRTNIHRCAGQHIRRANQYGEADLLDKLLHIVHGGQRTPLGLVNADTVEHGGELVTVFGVVDGLRRGAENRHTLRIEFQRKVVRYLPACGYDDTERIFQFEDVHDPLKSQLVEIEPVAHIVVGGYRFGVVVNHDRAVPVLADGLQRLHSAPVELYRRADTVSTRAEHYDRAVVARVVNIVLCA